MDIGRHKVSSRSFCCSEAAALWGVSAPRACCRYLPAVVMSKLSAATSGSNAIDTGRYLALNPLRNLLQKYPIRIYSHAPHNDVSVKDGPLIRRWSHKVIIISNLSNDRSKASCKTVPPHSAIYSFLLQFTVSSPVLKVVQ